MKAEQVTNEQWRNLTLGRAGFLKGSNGVRPIVCRCELLVEIFGEQMMYEWSRECEARCKGKWVKLEDPSWTAARPQKDANLTPPYSPISTSLPHFLPFLLHFTNDTFVNICYIFTEDLVNTLEFSYSQYASTTTRTEIQLSRSFLRSALSLLVFWIPRVSPLILRTEWGGTELRLFSRGHWVLIPSSPSPPSPSLPWSS